MGDELRNNVAERHSVVVTIWFVFARSGGQISGCRRAVARPCMSIPPGHSCMRGLIHDRPSLCNL